MTGVAVGNGNWIHMDPRMSVEASPKETHRAVKACMARPPQIVSCSHHGIIDSREHESSVIRLSKLSFNIMIYVINEHQNYQAPLIIMKHHL